LAEDTLEWALDQDDTFSEEGVKRMLKYFDDLLLQEISLAYAEGQWIEEQDATQDRNVALSNLMLLFNELVDAHTRIANFLAS
jgi:hypothetical protein